MSFRVGQKVVCVDDVADEGRIWGSFGGASPLQKGAIYTIAGTRPSAGYHSETCYGLVETAHPWGFGFRATRFRPVVERKTSIEVFTRMLTPNKERVS